VLCPQRRRPLPCPSLRRAARKPRSRETSTLPPLGNAMACSTTPGRAGTAAPGHRRPAAASSASPSRSLGRPAAGRPPLRKWSVECSR
jgi:hypothetical protein